MNLETLQKFSSSDWWRPMLAKPFTYEGKTYATDGYALIRVNSLVEGAEEYPDFPYDRIENNYQGPFSEPLPLKDFWSEVETEVCSSCKGTGYIQTCTECNGDGYLMLDSGWNTYEVQCQTCEGEGEVEGEGSGEECDNCDGTGKVSLRKRVKIGASEFDNRLLNKFIENLPKEATISPSSNPGRAALLSWEGGTGLIMPLRT